MKMKNLKIILIALIGISFMFSCEKVEKDPVLDMSKTVAPGITTPASGAAFVLIKEEAANVMTTFEWTPTQYNLTDLETTTYILQMDLEGNNFADPLELISTKGNTYSMTVGQMNGLMLANLELNSDEPYNFEARVRSFVNQASDYSDVYSPVSGFTVTAYSDEIYVKPVYLIGSGTTIGWDNTLALPMEHIGNGRFARVETITTGTDKYIKFLSKLAQWAPQWGTDAAGTSASGNLVYRPDELTTDPPGIPFLTGDAGNYYIMADTATLVYETFLTSGNLFLVGDATPAGWDAGAAIAFTESSPHIFTLTTQLNAGGGMKFLEVQGAWAPQWGTNDKGNNKKGLLSYRPNETVADPPSIPGPTAAGNYTITVDLTTMQYSVETK
jgi:starch-binding outer membrane protein SusE/F